MPAKIRLQRQGRKFQAIYSIVVADSRAPRDGKFIESLGQYNPNSNPATIVLDFDRALEWLQKGAQPTDTCRAILSYKGVLYKKHLLDGVKKGAFDEAEAEKRFQSWMTEKEQKIQAKRDHLKSSKEKLDKSRLEEESKIKDARAAELARKRSELIKAESEEESPEQPEAEEAVAEEPVEAAEVVAEEQPAAEAEEAKVVVEVADVQSEAVAEEPAEVADAVAEEQPAAEAEEEEAEEEPEAEEESGKKEE